jgi:hypothetical protein
MQLLNLLQSNLINCLRSLLTEELTGVYSFVPFDAKYPFVRIAEIELTPWRQAGQPAFITENNVSIYTNDKSNKKILEITYKVQERLLADNFNNEFYTLIKRSIEELNIKQTADLRVWQSEIKVINWVVQNV